MQPKYYDEWNKKYAVQIQKEYTEKMCKRLQNEMQPITGMLTEQIEDFLKSVSMIQDKAPFEAGCIQGALLAWSVRERMPRLIYEVFDTNQEFGMVMAAKEYSIPWLFVEWEELEKQLQRSIVSNGYAAKLTKEAVYCVINEQIKVHMLILSYLAKYVFCEFDRLEYFSQLKLNEHFYASMGAYRDYAKVFYRYKKSNEIFTPGTDKDFDYVRFNKMAYKKKNIMGYSFKNAIFSECIFKDVNMTGCDFTDCQFIDCYFENVSVSDGKISGCTWLNGKLKKVSFNEVFCKSGIVTKNGRLVDICKKTEFKGIVMDGVSFTNMDKEECDFKECIHDGDVELTKELPV